MPPSSEISTGIHEEGEIEAELSPKEKVTQSLKDGLSIFETIPEDKITPEQKAEQDEIKKRVEDLDNGGDGTVKVELKDEKGKVIKTQLEGIPVSQLLLYLEDEIKLARTGRNTNQVKELSAIVKNLTSKKYTKDYFHLPYRWVPRYYQARYREELQRMETDGRATGDPAKDLENAENAIIGRKELFIPPINKPIVPPHKPKEESEVFTVAFIDASDDAKKIAREGGGEWVREQLRIKNKLNPLEWMRAIGFRWGEKYHHYQKTQEGQREQMRTGHHFIEVDAVSGAFKVVAGDREQLTATARRFAEASETGRGIHQGEEVQKLENAEINKRITDAVKKYAKGEITRDQLSLENQAIVTALKANPDTAQYIKDATFIADNLSETADRVKASYERGTLGIENLDKKFNIQVGRALMAAQTEADYSTLEKTMNWLQGGKYRGLLANPLVIGIAFGVAGKGAISVLGWGARAATAFPLAGAAVGGFMTGLRRWVDLKRDLELGERDKTYSRFRPDIRPEQKDQAPRRTKLEEFGLNHKDGGGIYTYAEMTQEVQALSSADLTTDVGIDALIKKIAEVEARINYGNTHKKDMLAFSSRYTTETEMYEAIHAQSVGEKLLRNAFKEKGMNEVNINTELSRRFSTATDTFWAQYETVNKHQSAEFNKFRRVESAKAAAWGALSGLGGAVVSQELMAEAARNLPVLTEIPVANWFFRKGQTGAEKVAQNIGPLFGHSEFGTGPASVDTFKDMFQHGGRVDMGGNVIAQANPDHSFSFFDKTTNQPIPDMPSAHVEVDGKVIVSGNLDHLPNEMKDWVQTETMNHSVSQQIQEAVKNTADPDTKPVHLAVGDAQIAIKNDGAAIQVFDHNGNVIAEAGGKVNPDGNLHFTSGNPEDISKIQTALENQGFQTQAEDIPGKSITENPVEHFRDKGMIEKIHRDLWHGNNTDMHPDTNPKSPTFGKLIGADGKEIQFFHHALDDGSFDMDMSKMVSKPLPGGAGLNFDGTIDSQYAMLNNDITTNSDGTRTYKNMFALFTLDDAGDNAREVIKVPFDSTGHLNIPNDSELHQLLKANPDKTVDQLTRYIEVAHFNEESKQFDILATSVGKEAGPITVSTPGLHTLDATPPLAHEFLPPVFEAAPMFPTPFSPRRPLETLNEKSIWIPGSVETSGGNQKRVEILKIIRQRLSPTLKEKGGAKLDPYKEANMYFERQPTEYMAEIKDLAESIPETVSPNLRSIICIPVADHQEGKNIYQSLENYALQDAPRDQFEILLLLNHPQTDKTGTPIYPDNTETEIERFKQKYPDFPIRVIKKTFPISQAKIGNVRKYLNDVALYRHIQRGADAGDVIMISNDADNKGLAPTYISNFIKKFDENPKVDGLLGQLDWDPEAYAKYPLVHIGTRLFQYLNASGRKRTGGMSSSGANFAFRGSIYAGIGGYIAEAEGAEDVAIGWGIIDTRGERSSLGYAGARVSRLYTSARRSIDALKSGIAPVNQWEKGFSAFDNEIRQFQLGTEINIDYNDPQQLENFKVGLEAIINQTLDSYESGDRLGKGGKFYRKAIGSLGIKYRIDKNQVVITDMHNLVQGLKRYQKIGVLLRDIKSGKGTPEMKAELTSLHQEFIKDKLNSEAQLQKESEVTNNKVQNKLNAFNKEPLSLPQVPSTRYTLDDLKRSTQTVEEGNYIICLDTSLGSGQMGKMVAGYDKNTGEILAFKHIKKTEREYIARTNNYPNNVVDLEDFLKDKISNPTLGLYKDKIDKGDEIIKIYPISSIDLGHYLETVKVMDPKDALLTIIKITEALRDMHNQGVVHLDLAPSNILINQDSIKIIDFDAASTNTGSEKKFTRGFVGGYRRIIPPELFEENPTITESSDTYEVAILLHRLVTGKYPYNPSLHGTPEEQREQFYEAHKSGQFLIPDTIPQAIRNILIKGIQPIPGNRYQNTNEMLGDLLTAYDALKTPAPIPTTTPPEPVKKQLSSTNNAASQSSAQRNVIPEGKFIDTNLATEFPGVINISAEDLSDNKLATTIKRIRSTPPTDRGMTELQNRIHLLEAEHPELQEKLLNIKVSAETNKKAADAFAKSLRGKQLPTYLGRSGHAYSEHEWFQGSDLTDLANHWEMPLLVFVQNSNHFLLGLKEPEIHDGKWRALVYDPFIQGERWHQLNNWDINNIDFTSTVINPLAIDGLKNKTYNLSLTGDQELANNQELYGAKQTQTQPQSNGYDCGPLVLFAAALRNGVQPGTSTFKTTGRTTLATDTGVNILTREELIPPAARTPATTAAPQPTAEELSAAALQAADAKEKTIKENLALFETDIQRLKAAGSLTPEKLREGINIALLAGLPEKRIADLLERNNIEVPEEVKTLKIIPAVSYDNSGPRQNVILTKPKESIPKAIPTQQGSLLDRMKSALETNATGETAIDTTPTEIVNYLKTVKLPMGATIKEALPQIVGNQLKIDGEISTMAGGIKFSATLENDGSNGLKTVTHSVKLPFLARSQQGAIEAQITNLNQIIKDQVNKQIDPAWEVANFSIAGDKLHFDFRKKIPSVTPTISPELNNTAQASVAPIAPEQTKSVGSEDLLAQQLLAVPVLDPDIIINNIKGQTLLTPEVEEKYRNLIKMMNEEIQTIMTQNPGMSEAQAREQAFINFNVLR